MTSQMAERESQFKSALQKVEREVMRSFAFKKEISYGIAGDVVAHSTLSEVMSLEGDHIVISFITNFEGIDLRNMEKNLR